MRDNRHLHPIEGGGNGTHVTRAELAAHVRRIDEHLEALNEGQKVIMECLTQIADNATRWRRWWGERVAAAVGQLIDRVFVIGLVAGGAALLTLFLSSR